MPEIASVSAGRMALPSFDDTRRLAEAGDRRHMVLLSFYHHLGIGTRQDDAVSDHWLAGASLSDNAEYLCHLGELRERGDLVRQSFDDAKKAYSEAMKLDEAKGAYMLGRLSLNKEPTNPYHDLKTAVAYFRRAMACGHLPSRVILLQMHLRAGWRLGLPAIIPLVRSVVAVQRAVFAGQRDVLWRYRDVFRATRVKRKYVGDGQTYLIPRALDDVVLERLAPR